MAGVNRTLASAAAKAQQSLAGFNAFGQQLTAVGTRLSLALTAPLAGFAVAAVRGSASMDTLRRGLTATMKSATAAEAELKKLQETAKLPAIDLEDAVRGSIRLQTLGTSANESRRIMTELANAIATVGGSKADFSEVIRQLSQMAAVGRVTNENLKPIMERVPQIAAIIREKFGAAALGEPAKTFEKMGVSAKDAITIIIDELSKTERATGGTRNAFENLQAAALKFAVSVGDSIVKATGLDKRLIDMANALEKLAARFDALPESVKAGALALGAFTAAAPLFLIAAGQVAQSITAIIAVMKTLQGLNIAAAFTSAAFALSNGLVPALTLAEKAAAGLLIALRALPWVGLAAGIAYLGSKLVEYGEKGDTVKPKLDAINKKWDEQHGIIRSLNPAYDSLLKGVRAIAPVQDKTAASAGNLAGETSKAAAAIDSMGGPIRRSASDLMDMADAFRQARESAAALANARINMDVEPPDLSAIADIGEIADRAARSIGDVTEALEKQRRIDNVTTATIKDMEGAWEKTGKAAEKANQRTVSTLSEVQREVRRAFDGMARGMADSIVKWQGFGDTLKRTAQEFASGILEIFIQRLLDPLQKKFEEILGVVFGKDGKVGIINNAVSGAGGTAGAAGSAGSGGGGAGAAGSGLTGIIGAASGVVGAISSVIGNFQMAGMNKSLDLIEHATRFSESHLLHLIGEAQKHWPELGYIRGYLFDNFNPAFASLMSTVEGMAGKKGSNQTIQLVVDGKVLAEALARVLPHHSNAFA
jgi:tape measure domain-containing protein